MSSHESTNCMSDISTVSENIRQQKKNSGNVPKVAKQNDQSNLCRIFNAAQVILIVSLEGKQKEHNRVSACGINIQMKTSAIHINQMHVWNLKHHILPQDNNQSVFCTVFTKFIHKSTYTGKYLVSNFKKFMS